MEKDRNSIAPSWTAVVIALSLLLLPVLYVLSPGPVVWLLDRGYVTDHVVTNPLIGSVYAPLNYVLEATDHFGGYWWTYMDLWRK